jgi:hypothetical protein
MHARQYELIIECVEVECSECIMDGYQMQHTSSIVVRKDHIYRIAS